MFLHLAPLIAELNELGAVSPVTEDDMAYLSRFIGIAFVLFTVTLAGMIGARIDQTTIALLGGTFIGLLIATPCTALVTYIILKAHNESSSYRQQAQPTQYWVVPPSYPTSLIPTPPPAISPATSSYSEPFVLPPKRRFYIIGENGESSEIKEDSDGTF